MQAPFSTAPLSTETFIPDRFARPYYAIQVRIRRERLVCHSLNQRGFHPYLPVYESRRQWADRVRTVEVPLFPGYLFCPLDIHNRLPLLSVPGVTGIVGAGKTPIPVEPNELEAIRIMIATGVAVEACMPLTIGRKVKIQKGPLAGVEGVIIERRGHQRLVVTVSLLNRSVSAVVDPETLVPDVYPPRRASCSFDSRVA
jgi:transcription antitermination factor NusG